MGYWYVSEKASSLPVSVDDVAAHLRIDSPSSEPMLSVYIQAATEQIEALIGPIISQTITQLEDSWPSADRIYFRVPRVTELLSASYRMYTDTVQQLDTASYKTDLVGGHPCLYLVPGASWPAVSLWPVSPIKLEYKAGWASSSVVPSRVRQAILLLAGLYYESREAASLIQNSGVYVEVPWGIYQLVADYRWGWP